MKLSKIQKLLFFKRLKYPSQKMADYFAKLAGDYSGGVTPVPIPNTAVKPSSADGTCGATHRESRTSPASNYNKSRRTHKVLRLFFLFVGCLVLGGCATSAPYHLTSDDRPKNVPYVEGEDAVMLTSIGQQTDVNLTATRIPTGELFMQFQFGNHSNLDLEVRPDLIHVWNDNKDGKGRSLRTYNSEEYAKKNKARAGRKGMILDVSENALNFGGMVASAVLPGAGSLVGVAQQIVTGGASRQIRQMNIVEEVWGKQAAENILKRHTLYPKGQSQGSLISDATQSDRYRVEVPIGEDKHVFRLVRSNARVLK